MPEEESIKEVAGYHTQELRSERLQEPIWCDTVRAWLGPAYYFWERYEHARAWADDGEKIKISGGYSMYMAEIDLSNNLDTCYSKEADELFTSSMDKAVSQIQEAGGGRVNHLAAIEIALQEIFLVAKVEVITYCDMPRGPLWSTTHPLYYKKRVQFAVLTRSAFHNFRHLEDGP